MGQEAADIRWISEHEALDWHRAFRAGFFIPPSADPAAEEAFARAFFQPGRLVGAFDGGRCVGTLRSIPFELTLPGGAVPADGISSVTVTSTHRRRGLLTGMIGRALDAARDRGDTVSILIAAEYGIYGRYGFGWAAERSGLAIDLARSGGIRDGIGELRGGASVELVDLAEFGRLAPALHDRWRAGQPGAISRPQRVWQLATGEIVRPGETFTAPFTALYRDAAGTPQGLLAYRVDRAFAPDGTPDSTLRVTDLIAPGREAAEALWRYAFSVDWVRRVTVPRLAADDPLPLLLNNPRGAVPQPESVEDLWLRVLDPERAFGARSYPSAPAARTVLRVHDRQGHADGTWLLETDGRGRGALTRRAVAAPDAELDAAQLGSLLLGSIPAARLAAARLLTEHTAGAAELLTRQLHALRAPFSIDGF